MPTHFLPVIDTFLDFERIWRALTSKTLNWDKLLEKQTKKGDKKIVEMTFNTEDYSQLRWHLPPPQHFSSFYMTFGETLNSFSFLRLREEDICSSFEEHHVYHDGEDIISH